MKKGFFISIFLALMSVSFVSAKTLPLDYKGNQVSEFEAREFLKTPVVTIPVDVAPEMTRVSDSKEQSVLVTIENVVEWAATAASSLNLPSFILLIITALSSVIRAINSVIEWIKKKKAESM